MPSSGTATIYAVSFYTVVPDVECVIKVYNNVSANNPVNGTPLLTQTKKYTFVGYHTLSLDTAVNVSGRFSVVIKLTTPSYSYPIAVEYPFSGYSSEATAAPGESFISSDGTSWFDCGASSPAFNVCIKAFGTGIAPAPTPAVTYTPLLNDFDGDLRGDLSLYNAAQGKLYVLSSRYNFGRIFLLSGWGGTGYKALAGILDDDLFEDPILYYSAAGIWYFASSQSGYQDLYYMPWGDASSQPVAADFNGDRYIDPAVYNNGWWYILLSQGSPITYGYSSYAYGYFYLTGALPMAGDVDGDGFADPVLYNPNSGIWYVLLSCTAYTQWIYAQWGGTGVSPCAGDFDGDGRADAGVFNNSYGEWRGLLSRAGYMQEIDGIWKP
jgi:hypothetical protein